MSHSSPESSEGFFPDEDLSPERERPRRDLREHAQERLEVRSGEHLLPCLGFGSRPRWALSLAMRLLVTRAYYFLVSSLFR